MAGRPRRRDLDEVDRALVAALQRDGRASNVDLAAQIGVTEKTVRLRMARLESEHGLVISAHLAGSSGVSRLMCLLRTNPSRRIAVAESLAGLPGVEQVYLASGAADVVVIAGFSDDSAALHFLVTSVEGHDGVESVQSCHLIDGASSTSAPGGRQPRIDRDVLSALTIAAAPRQSAEAVMAAVCDAAISGLGADRVVLAYGDPEGARPVCDGPTGPSWHAPLIAGAKRGVSEEYLARVSQRLGDEVHGVIRRVWESRVHVVVADATTDPLMAGLHDLVREAGYTALLALPMLYGQSLLATVCLYFDEPTVLSGEYVATAQRIVDFFSVAFARGSGLAPTDGATQS
ncbi:AsnC family transcriptional regulator [Rhodococcus erythropolis]